MHARDLELAILDMAGTTVNENGCVGRAFVAAIEHVGRGQVDAQTLHGMRGRSKKDVFAHLLPSADLASAAHAEFIRYLLHAIGDGQLQACAGAEGTLRALRAESVKVCLITGFDAEIQQALMDHLGWGALVDLALSPTGGVRGRPFPDLIFQAMLQLQPTGVQSVLVAGDTTNDLLSGYRAGVGTLVGVLGGAHSRAELESMPHTHLADGIGRLVETIAEPARGDMDSRASARGDPDLAAGVGSASDR
jgi:phosphoglycolate phosphatase